MNTKIKAVAASNVCVVEVGYYFKLVLPVAKVSAFLAFLDEGKLVETQWSGNDSYLVERDAETVVKRQRVSVLTAAEYESICEAEFAERTIAKMVAATEENADPYFVFESNLKEAEKAVVMSYASEDSVEPFREAMHNIGKEIGNAKMMAY